MSQAQDLIIRPAEERDIPRVSELLADICILHREGRPDIFKPGTKYNTAQLQALFSDPEHLVLVAEECGRTVGYAICLVKKHFAHPVFCDFTTMYIDDLCVDTSCRGKGIGRRLFDEVRCRANELGAHNIELNVWAFNKGAVGFYESLGMRPQRMMMELVLDK